MYCRNMRRQWPERVRRVLPDPKTPNLPNMPDAPDLPNLPDMRHAPDAPDAPLARALRTLRGARAWRLPLLVSLANQAVSSGGNFLLGLYLARRMPIEQFGLYGMCYSACMLYVGVGNALLLTRLNVGLPGRPPAEQRQRAGRLLVALLSLNALLLAPALALALGASRLPAAWQAVLQPLLPVAPAAALFLCTEFFISYAYLQRREHHALAQNATAMAALALLLVALDRQQVALSAANVLGAYALAAGLGCLQAYAGARPPLRHAGGELRDECHAAWRQGSWALGGVGITWLQAQSYTYALAALLGPAGVGLANMARIFISPFSFLLPAVNKLAIPRLAELRVTDPARTRRLSRRLTAALTALALAYGIGVFSCFSLAERLLLGRSVPGVAPLAALWCGVLVFQVLRSGGAVLMQIEQRFRALTLLNLPSALVTLAATAPLAWRYGAPGALLGLLAGELTLTYLIWKEIRYAPIPATAAHG